MNSIPPTSSPPPKSRWRDWQILLISMMGIGFIPWAPGTFASLASLSILIFLIGQTSPLVFLAIILLSLYPFVRLINSVQRRVAEHDPSWIVIDELVGMSIAFILPLMIIPNLGISIYIYGIISFILFRFFDITKIYPANWLDRNLKHGWGVILDDIVSGLYSACILLLLHYLLLSENARP
jgi:phosphatidylglycerophosphatase A